MKSILLLTGVTIGAAQYFPGQPSCAIPCLTSAIAQAGCNLNDIACPCGPTQAAIGAAAAGCLIGACNATELAQAQSAGSAVCSSLSAGELTISSTATGSATSTGSMSITSAPSSSSTGSTSGGSEASSGSMSNSLSRSGDTIIGSTSGTVSVSETKTLGGSVHTATVSSTDGISATGTANAAPTAAAAKVIGGVLAENTCDFIIKTPQGTRPGVALSRYDSMILAEHFDRVVTFWVTRNFVDEASLGSAYKDSVFKMPRIVPPSALGSSSGGPQVPFPPKMSPEPESFSQKRGSSALGGSGGHSNPKRSKKSDSKPEDYKADNIELKPRLTTPDLEFDYDRSQLRDPRPTPGRVKQPRMSYASEEWKSQFSIPKPEKPKGRLSRAQKDELDKQERPMDPSATFHHLYVCHRKGRDGSPTYDEAGFQLDWEKVNDWFKPRPYSRSSAVRGMERRLKRDEAERRTMFDMFFVDGKAPATHDADVTNHMRDHVSKDLGIPWHQIGPEQLKIWREKGFEKVEADEWWRPPNDEERKRMLNMLSGASMRKNL
ncbi:hypothetical protein SUNI508_07415 [Seiridium unicorne]|uniref:CFEM domain-containing protein n=1 Tax=Seiridium unicorne TaxID=138068 RepID=A0ABR2UXM0_9PEZI